ncbi:MAG: hypothetical protein Q7J07_07790 [Pelolinea sp.]|nr:hypothetical protein [Pelolinea sp.]
MPSGMVDLNTRMQWTTRGENCTMCDALRGRVYTYDMWMSASVWPGFHINCNCYLKPVGDEITLSDPDFFGMDIPLHLNSWFSPFAAILQFNRGWQPGALTTLQEIEQAHKLYGTGVPIGQVLKRMRNDFEGFFKRSTIWDNFFQWRVLRTIHHIQNVEGEFSGETPPGFRGLFDWGKIQDSSVARWRSTSLFLNPPLQAEDLSPLSPWQSNFTERY